MSAHARFAGGMLAALLLSRASAQAPPSPPATPPPAASIDAQLAAASALAAQGDPRGAHKLLVDMLQREGPSEALKPRAPSIDALLRDTQFAQTWHEPAARELPGGVVGKWSESDGPITLRYTRSTTVLEPPFAGKLPGLAWLDKLADDSVAPVIMLSAADHMLAGGGVLVHEALFGPEWALEIKGDLPEDECNVVPHVFLCVEEGSHYDLALTWPTYVAPTTALSGEITGRQGRLRRIAKGVVAEDHLDPNPIERYGMKKRRSYTVVVKLKPDEIFFSINGMSGPRVPRDPAAGGRLGYTAFPNVTSIEVTGAKDAAWLAGLAKVRHDDARAKFDADRPADRAVPEWWAGVVKEAKGPAN